MDRVALTEQALLDELGRLRDVPPAGEQPTGIDAGMALQLFTWQVTSRALDVAARRLKAAGTGYYTIASAGHEDNVLVGAILRGDDPAFLHYRSGAFMQARLSQDPSADPIGDVIRSFGAAADDPVSAGRHKVWGSANAWVPPQTSTISSQLPKAVGVAFAIGRRERGGWEPAPGARPLADDAIVMTSFGDASLNHATALTAINAARYAKRRGQPVPMLFVCEDNGLGISVDTPRRWVQDLASGWRHLTYLRADGELDERLAVVEEAVATCREQRTPVFLHLPTVRLWGHAGSDVEMGYRTMEAITADESRDPLLRTARWLVMTGRATADELAALVEQIRADVVARTDELGGGATLPDAAAVMAPLAPLDDTTVRRAVIVPAADQRAEAFSPGLPETLVVAGRRTLAAHMNAALHDVMLAHPEAAVFGEDVGHKGGVYGVTNGLQQRFGIGRVFDTLLDETTILGVAQGLGLAGGLAIPEIQYLAYLHNALDQLRGEAASTSFFSNGAYTTPMVVRLAGLAYQKGFGGHFHNDNAIGALRDIPGMIVASPSRGDDAVRMFRGLVAASAAHGQVSVFLEPIALYHQRDLLTAGDEGWLTDHPDHGQPVLLPGEVGVYDPSAVPGRVDGRASAPAAGVEADEPADVVVFTFANGVPMSLRARAAAPGLAVRVVDLRWLRPLPHDAILAHAVEVGRVLVVDECRATGGIADEVIAHLAEGGFTGPMKSVRSKDSFVPLGPAADHVLLGEHDIIAALQTFK